MAEPHADMLALTERTEELVRSVRDRLGELGTAHGYSLELHRAIDATSALGIHAKTMLRATRAEQSDPHRQKIVVCEALIAINEQYPDAAPIIPPTAIDWIGNAHRGGPAMTRRTATTTAPRGQCRCRRLAVTWLSMCAVCREQYPLDNGHAIAPPEADENGRDANSLRSVETPDGNGREVQS